MDNIFYYVWLSKLYFIMCEEILKLIRKYGSLEELYNEDNSETFKNINLNNYQKNMYIKSKDRNEILKDIDFIEKENIGIMYYHEKEYPEILKEIYEPPVIIFYKGNKDVFKLQSISIVGARKCSEYGIKIARQLSSFFSGIGICITSGMAYGIDSEAHRAALDMDGSTIAVLGCGMNIDYPSGNIKLKRCIETKGCLISEFPINMQPLKRNFPRRNRIISGLSSDIIVVEAEERSGSLITGKYAIEQNRNLYAVPGSVYSEKSIGCNKLINEGAYLLENEFTIIEQSYQIKQYINKNKIKIDKMAKKNLKNKQIQNCEEHKIYDILIERKSLNEIIQEMNIDIVKLQRILTSMEIRGLIKRNYGDMFCRMY